MTEDTTTSRVLGLLSLLQTRRVWTGPELARRLGVSGRTVRRDVERLRTLGYRVDAERGQVGGYQLAPGADLPPLLLNDEEAVTLTVSLQLAALHGPAVGEPDTALAVLAKLHQVLPKRLQRRASAVRSSTVVLTPPGEDPPAADPDVLIALAQACRDAERVRLTYQAADGERTTREVEPTALVTRTRRWYLVCWDLTRHAWRTLRVDRTSAVRGTGATFAPRTPPQGDVAAFVAEQFRTQPVHRGEVLIEATLTEVRRYLGRYGGDLRPAGAARTRWSIEADHLETLVGRLVWLPWDYAVEGPAELRGLARAAAARMARGTPVSPAAPG